MNNHIDWDNLQPLTIPGFSRQEETSRTNNLVSTPKGKSVPDWFEEFTSRVSYAIDNGGYLPIFRASDGEFSFVLGRSLSNQSLRYKAAYFHQMIKNRSPFFSSGRNGYCETYPFWELKRLRKQFAVDLQFIAEKGIICLNFSQSPLSLPYQQKFVLWLEQQNINLTYNNYYHFYFVYAFLLGCYQSQIIEKRKIVIFTSNINGRKEQIMMQLLNMGAAKVAFYETSNNQPMKDLLDLESLDFQPDLCLVGAGVGSANLLRQLEPLQCVCIDAGYVLDIFGEDSLRIRRPYCVPDQLWNEYFSENVDHVAVAI